MSLAYAMMATPDLVRQCTCEVVGFKRVRAMGHAYTVRPRERAGVVGELGRGYHALPTWRRHAGALGFAVTLPVASRRAVCRRMW